MSIFNIFNKGKSTTELAISAELAVRSGDFNKGIKLYTKAIELEPSYPDFYLNRAEALWLVEDVKFGVPSDKKRDLMRLNDYNKAIELLESGNEKTEWLKYKLPKAYFDRACQKNLLGDNDGARSDGLKSQELGHPQKEFSKLPIDLTE